MTTLMMTFVVFFAVIVVIAGLARLTGRFLRGSCGGVAGECVCKAEGKLPGACEYENGAQLPVAEAPSER